MAPSRPLSFLTAHSSPPPDGTAAHARSPEVAAAAAAAAYVGGAVALAGEGVVHIQQYASIFHAVSWVGPLFIGNAVACLVAIAGIARRPTRRLAALGGVVVSALALGSLVVSYGNGLLGWHEAGFRTPIALAALTEVIALILLPTALASRSPISER